MELKVSKNSTLTIHVQLKEQIKGLILDEVLIYEAQLPTVRQLGEFLQINKNTVSDRVVDRWLGIRVGKKI